MGYHTVCRQPLRVRMNREPSQLILRYAQNDKADGVGYAQNAAAQAEALSLYNLPGLVMNGAKNHPLQAHAGRTDQRFPFQYSVGCAKPSLVLIDDPCDRPYTVGT